MHARTKRAQHLNVNTKKILLWSAVWATFLAAGAVSPPVSAQQVEVVANGTQLRLDPSDSSLVIATLSAGTVLERVGESGATTPCPSRRLRARSLW